ncbi:hypothetical protein [Protaetiibacter sp. SSC-01]|uniref:hypothetical protein n=1 Tax=Protaetiibacter sp. SSC-01 TaxID=2759943 RepID=UPI00223C45CC|nr:hypothetical protein [Protaetiibacter sp. SSC-01]
MLEAFRALGAPEEEAQAAAEMCLDSELREHRSHGARLVRNIAREYAQGAERRRELVVEHATPASATVAVETLLGEIADAGGRVPGEQSRVIREAHLASGTVTLDDNAIEVLGLSR